MAEKLNQLLADAPLSVRYHDQQIVITIGERTLKDAAENGPSWPCVTVLDASKFAKAVAEEIANEEDEAGNTPLTRAIDSAMERVFEGASESVSYDEEAWKRA